MKKDENVKMGIVLPKKLYDKLEKAYEESGIPKSNIIKLVLVRYLDEFLYGKGGNN